MTKEARIHNEEKTVSSISGAKKTGQLHIDEIRTFSDNVYESTFNCKTRNHKTSRREHRAFFDIIYSNFFLISLLRQKK